MILRKNQRVALVLFLMLSGAYVVGPIVAAFFAYPDRRGPKIYPRGYHETVFIVAYELFHQGEKPRIPFDRGRAWFYGMERPVSGRSRVG